MTQWIATNADLANLAQAWQGNTLLGLDTEFLRTNTFNAKLALIQLSRGDEVALIDWPALTERDCLATLIAAPGVSIIMHSASEDLEALAPLLPQGLHQLYDTQVAAAIAGLGHTLSYQRLVATLLGIELPKSETRSDWFARPLSAAQLEYAVQDVVHLPVIKQELDARLATLGRAAWHAEDCARMLSDARNAQPDPEPHLAFRTAAAWPIENQALLRRVLRWRENTARREDKPRTWLLDNPLVLDITQYPPEERSDLAARSKAQRALKPPLREELWLALNVPLSAADLDLPAIPGAHSPEQRKLIAALKAEVAAVATELDLPEALLCPRRHLETLVDYQIWPARLSGWRKALLEERLMRVLLEGANNVT